MFHLQQACCSGGGRYEGRAEGSVVVLIVGGITCIPAASAAKKDVTSYEYTQVTGVRWIQRC